MSTGILLLRLALGAALVLQGTAELNRRDRHAAAAFFDDVGIRPGLPLALLAGGTELGVGALIRTRNLRQPAPMVVSIPSQRRVA